MPTSYIQSLSLSRTGRHTISAACIGLTLLALFAFFDDFKNDSSYAIRKERRIHSSYAISKERRLLHSDEDAPNDPKKRLALLRPFAPTNGKSLLESFSLWDTRWPCMNENDEYEVDLVISYSHRLDSDKEARAIVDEIWDKFMGEEIGGWWSECFVGLRVIEADLDVSHVLFV